MPQGARRSRLVIYLDGFLGRGVEVLPYDRAAAEWHAAQRARLATLGTPSPCADGWIAAVAATRGPTLVTLNGPGFRRFAGLAA